MLTALHHIALLVRDIPTAANRYAQLFNQEPVWHGMEDGTEHVWFQFSNLALKVVAPSGVGDRGNRARSQLATNGEGIWSIAFATRDIATTRHVLQRRGIASSALQRHSIDMQLTEKRSWTTASLATENTFGVALEIIEANDDFPTPAIANGVVGLDHVVIYTSHPERAAALYGARLGLDLKLDRTNPDWGSRLLFFKCGDLTVEIAHSLKNSDSNAPDKAWGLSWRVADAAAAHERIANAGFNLSEVRVGRKPGTHVFTVRDAPGNVPTLVMDKT